MAALHSRDNPSVHRERKIIYLLAPLSLVLAIAVVFLSVQLYRVTSDDRRKEQARVVAREFAERLTTYSYQTLDADIEKVLELATGSFKRDYDQVLGGDTFRTSLQDVQGSSTGKVLTVTVADIDGSEATAVAIVEQTIRNKNLDEPRIRTSRIEMTMVETSAGWRVNSADNVQEV